MSSEKLSHKERLQAVLKGEKPDRIPVAFWRHWPVDDQDSEMLCHVTLEYQKKFDMDWIKLTPSSSYTVTDWGAKHEYRGKAIGERDYTERVIKSVDDWNKIEVLDITKGRYGDTLKALEKVIKQRDKETPVLMTIFTASRIAGYMAGDDQVPIYLRKYPEVMKRALDAISETTENFVKACFDRGVDGIFLSTFAASYEVMSEAEHDEFSRPYDLRVLDAAKDGWLNTIHLHGQYPMFDKVCDYPVSIINWHDRAAGPSIAEAAKKFPGMMASGVEQFEVLHCQTPKEIEAQVEDAIKQAEGRRLMISPGCTFPLTVPEGNLYTLRWSVDKFLP